MHCLGLIADTHGLLRPEAVRALQGVELIVHAGDIGTPDILPALEDIAPVRAIRGNIDSEPWALPYPETDAFDVGPCRIHVVHDRRGQLWPEGTPNVLVSGHSHRPLIERIDGVLHVNPGSAGRRRFRLPVTLALLTISQRSVDAQLVELLPTTGS